MNFAGYVPLRRGLIAHTQDGRLTNDEALAFVWLVMLADKETGRYTINGPTLRVFLPGLTKDGAKRVLASLQEKRYIYRDITPRSPIVYPYWIEGFIPTIGPHKSRQLDLSEVFATGDTSKLRYVKAAPEGALDTALGTALGTAPEGALDTAHYNEKREKRSETRDQRLPDREDGETERASATDPAICATERRDGAMVRLDGAIAPDGSHSPNLRWGGPDLGWRDSVRNKPVYIGEINRRIAPLGLLHRDGKFFDLDDDALVPWELAQSRIEGTERKAAA